MPTTQGFGAIVSEVDIDREPDVGLPDVPVIKKPYGADSLRQAFGRSPTR